MTNSTMAKTKSQGVSVTGALARVLADTYTLYTKTQNFHWNVTGPAFPALHAQFEQQYQELAAAVDEIAERVRALGERTPASFKEFLAMGSVPEARGERSDQQMVQSLMEGHRIAARTAKAALDAAEAADDDVTMDMMVGRITAHDKAAWMLGSFLQK